MKIKFKKRLGIAIALLLFAPVVNGGAPAERNLPVPDADTIFGWLQDFTAPEHRRAGTPEHHRSVDYLAGKFREFGLEQVTKEPIEIMVWQARKWGLTVSGPDGPIEIPCFYQWNTAFTGPRGITAPMIYVGHDPDSWGEVAGKIVVAEAGWFPPNYFGFPEGHWFAKYFDLYRKAAHRGAAGMAFIHNVPYYPGYNTNTLYFPRFDPEPGPIPMLFIARSDGERLQRLAQAKAQATLLLDGENVPGTAFNVYGILPGQSEKNIIISSHSDSPHQGIIEDGSGIASVLAQARTWSKVPVSNRPRTLIFVATASHFYHCPLGSRVFAQTHQDDLMANTLMLINIEHVAAKKAEARGGELVLTGGMSKVMVNYQGNKYLRRMMKETFKEYPPAPDYTISGLPPFSDGAGYLFTLPDLPYITFMTAPKYLLTADDTMDKLDREWLLRANLSFARLVESSMNLETSRFSGVKRSSLNKILWRLFSPP
jgi:hypothetical protein